MTALNCQKKSPAVYKPRRPEKTVLFQVIKEYYKTWTKKSEKPDSNEVAGSGWTEKPSN